VPEPRAVARWEGVSFARAVAAELRAARCAHRGGHRDQAAGDPKLLFRNRKWNKHFAHNAAAGAPEQGENVLGIVIVRAMDEVGSHRAPPVYDHG